MNKTTIVALTTLIAAALSGIHPTRAQAVQAVSQQVYYTALKGNYSFSSLMNDDGSYPSSGTFTFDGRGNLTGVMNLYDNGNVCAGMILTGTYTVNPGLASGSATM